MHIEGDTEELEKLMKQKAFEHLRGVAKAEELKINPIKRLDITERISALEKRLCSNCQKWHESHKPKCWNDGQMVCSAFVRAGYVQALIDQLKKEG
jgi:hypothetical protein